eukprot:Em0002g84a
MVLVLCLGQLWCCLKLWCSYWSVSKAAWTLNPSIGEHLEPLDQADSAPVPYMGAPKAGVKLSGIWDTVAALRLLELASSHPASILWEKLLHRCLQ